MSPAGPAAMSASSAATVKKGGDTPRTALVTSASGHLGLSWVVTRTVISVALVASAVLVAVGWAVNFLTLETSCMLLGSFVGLLPSVLHVPDYGSAEPRLQGIWLRRFVAVSILIVSSVILGLEEYGTWQVGRGDSRVRVVATRCLSILPLATMSLVFAVCVCKPHPSTVYMRDAMWSMAGTWAALILYTAMGAASCWKARDADDTSCRVFSMFFFGAAAHLEGIVWTWNACLMLRRVATWDVGPGQEDRLRLTGRRARLMLFVMGCMFHCKTWIEIFAQKYSGPDFWFVYVGPSLLFIIVWVWCFVLITISVCRTMLLLHTHMPADGAPRAEVKWAKKVLSVELLFGLTIASCTAALWFVTAWQRFQGSRLQGLNNPEEIDAVLLDQFLVAIILHRLDLVINGVSVALLSGFLWQPRAPSPKVRRGKGDRQRCAKAVERLRGVLPKAPNFVNTQLEENHTPTPPPRDAFSRFSSCASRSPGVNREWAMTVEELAGRGVTLRRLLWFWEKLVNKELGVMLSFEPGASSTNDVVRQAIIPLSRDCDEPFGGKAMASVWASDTSMMPTCMVTHNWSNQFVFLLAGIIADFLDEACYEHTAKALLGGRKGCAKLESELLKKNALESVVWICAFCINQHAAICDGFGPEPSEEASEQRKKEFRGKTMDSVHGTLFPLCACSQQKIRNDDDPDRCELNKFDFIVRMLHNANTDTFKHIIVVDPAFVVFSRTWCIAEVVESNVSGVPQHIRIHSQRLLDKNYQRLTNIDVTKCCAAREEDEEMIMKKIRRKYKNVESFNIRLQWAIFGTQGLLSKWLDGQERAAMIGRFVNRAARAAKANGRMASLLSFDSCDVLDESSLP